MRAEIEPQVGDAATLLIEEAGHPPVAAADVQDVTAVGEIGEEIGEAPSGGGA